MSKRRDIFVFSSAVYDNNLDYMNAYVKFRKDMEKLKCDFLIEDIVDGNLVSFYVTPISDYMIDTDFEDVTIKSVLKFINKKAEKLDWNIRSLKLGA